MPERASVKPVQLTAKLPSLRVALTVPLVGAVASTTTLSAKGPVTAPAPMRAMRGTLTRSML
jgi:hypothetical protein